MAEMTEPTAARELFKGRQVDEEIIVPCERWYLAFKLSLRDLVQKKAERGIALANTTILRWVEPRVPEFQKRWNRYARPVSYSGTREHLNIISVSISLPDIHVEGEDRLDV
jgi:transposase-like protein